MRYENECSIINTMKHIFLCALLLLCSIPYTSEAADIHAGFVQGIWYATEPVVVHVPNRIYVAVRNNTKADLTGTIYFTDNNSPIGSSPISVLAGRLVEAWIDWTPTEGTHTVATRLGDVEIHEIGKEPQSVTIAGMTVQDNVTVDQDTDHDGLGDKTDLDDDNDNVSDTIEIQNGTNPLKAEDTKELTHSKDTTLITATTTVPLPLSAQSTEKGIEQYVDATIPHTLLSNVTNKITSAKTALDTYRTARNERLETDTKQNPVSTPASSTDEIVITRSSIEAHTSFSQSLINDISTIVQKSITALLFILSLILGHPALIQYALLVGILFMFYRIARRLGRRSR